MANPSTTLISIIVPVFNTAPYLDQMLESLCRQVDPTDTTVQVEIICVDDCSTDGSIDILKKWADRDPRVGVYMLHQNSGQSAARNLALQYAHGEWIYFMDSDDVLLPDALLNALWYAQHTNTDMVMFDAHVIDEDGKRITSSRYERSNEFVKDKVYNGHEVIATLLRTFTFRAVPWLYLVRASYLKKLDLHFPQGIIHEDEYYTACLTLACPRIAVLHEHLVEHRLRTASTMGRNFTRRNMDCYLRVVYLMEEWLKTHPEHKEWGFKYLRYTLTHVFITARCMPPRDRWSTLRHIIAHKYLRYIERKRLIQFIIGKHFNSSKSSSYISTLTKQSPN